MTLKTWDYEEFAVGRSIETGSQRFTHEEIVEFARKLNPQSLHLSDKGARETLCPGIVTPGWHTATIRNNLYINRALARAAGTGSPGSRSISWPRPVRPSNPLVGRVKVIGGDRCIPVSTSGS